uniref:Receptor L-domain domain-containing protein n=1 Tax=Panagrolaimus sp. JU765 TaxID=591449 RepID=A0AC34QV77_9BILA
MLLIKFLALLFLTVKVKAQVYGTYHPLKYIERNGTNLVFHEYILGNLILHNVDEKFWNNIDTVQPFVVREVRGYIHLKNINFNFTLKNLAVIHGEELEPETGAALLIEDCGVHFIDFGAQNLQLIKKGKVVIRNCPKLCVWNPNAKNGINYGALVQPLDVTPVNSRLFVVNSFQSCDLETKFCDCEQGCSAHGFCQKDPFVNTCPNMNCAFGCRKENLKWHCNACPDGYFLDANTKKCDKCDMSTAGLYCFSKKVDNGLEEDGEIVVGCSKDRTYDDDVCKKCHVDVSDSGKFFASCLKVCDGIVSPDYIEIANLYPGFSVDNYDGNVEYEEHELCSIANYLFFVDYQRNLAANWPPLSSLWFMSRLQYAKSATFSKFDADAMTYSNFRNVREYLRINPHHRYIDLGLVNASSYGYDVEYEKGQWFKPLRKDSRFGDRNSGVGKSGFSPIDCRCGYEQLDNANKNAECFVPGNCNKCNYGHRQYIDPQTKFMFTRCSQKPHDDK